MENVKFSQVDLKSGFWKEKQKLNEKTTINAVYDRFYETGRIDAFKCSWKEGMDKKPHIFWDSDVAKWIEGASYIIKKSGNKKLEKRIDSIVDDIEKNQGEDGYFNVYYTVVEPENRFTNRLCHELYCAGHLFEAACAYYEATGKRKFLDLMCKYADYIEKRFYIDRDTNFTTPGHEEIELALYKMYKVTNEKRYLDLSKFFIDQRGTKLEQEYQGAKPSISQSHLPVREQSEAIGHSVRAVYLYSAMADLAKETNDKELKVACEKLFDNITKKRMYITGGIGSSSKGEAFTLDYDLSNVLSYTESCAAIGLVFFANRMLKMDLDSKYSNLIERVLYNGFLSSLSLDGKSFFYENPLEVIPYIRSREVNYEDTGTPIHFPPMTRREYFNCSCCPPNITRFLASLGDYIYSYDDNGVYVHQYMSNVASFEYKGKKITLTQKTNYPHTGKVTIKVEGSDIRLGIRVPEYSDKKFDTIKGYAFYNLKDGEELTVDFGMSVKLYHANPNAIFDIGKIAIARGPVIYCIEGKDNESPIKNIRIPSKSKYKYEKHPELGVMCLKTKAKRLKYSSDVLYTSEKEEYEDCDVTLIPYYAFANRGSSEMQVWCYKY